MNINVNILRPAYRTKAW